MDRPIALPAMNAQAHAPVTVRTHADPQAPQCVAGQPQPEFHEPILIWCDGGELDHLLHQRCGPNDSLNLRCFGRHGSRADGRNREQLIATIRPGIDGRSVVGRARVLLLVSVVSRRPGLDGCIFRRRIDALQERDLRGRRRRVEIVPEACAAWRDGGSGARLGMNRELADVRHTVMAVPGSCRAGRGDCIALPGHSGGTGPQFQQRRRERPDPRGALTSRPRPFANPTRGPGPDLSNRGRRLVRSSIRRRPPARVSSASSGVPDDCSIAIRKADALEVSTRRWSRLDSSGRRRVIASRRQGGGHARDRKRFHASSPGEA